MKLNPDKCHLLVSRKKYECNLAKTGDDKIWDSNEVILLGQAIYKYLLLSQSKANCTK